MSISLPLCTHSTMIQHIQRFRHDSQRPCFPPVGDVAVCEDRDGAAGGLDSGRQVVVGGQDVGDVVAGLAELGLREWVKEWGGTMKGGRGRGLGDAVGNVKRQGSGMA